MKALIRRTDNGDKQTTGYMVVFNERNGVEYTCCTLELPWRNNERQISCIPTGTYKVVKRYSPKYKNHFHILDVPSRDFILIHQANYVRQLRGCISVGRTHTDIDGDGLVDTTHSVATMKELLDILPDEFEIVIESV